MNKQVVYRCGKCYKDETECVSCERGRLDLCAAMSHANGEDCGREDCQQCCNHDRFKDMCRLCGHIEDLSAKIDFVCDREECK